MARIVNILKTFRNHWKKTTFGVLLLSYGVDYGSTKLSNHKMLKSYCEEARKYGEVISPMGAPMRQVTVILNPASNGGKGKTDFENYCAPLLYLSGMKVSVVKTESVGEARKLMELMDNCDGIVVAGGDGALSEAVTGLLRRPDNVSAAQRFPIGIIPVGKKNNVAKSIFQEFKDNRVKLMAEATMAIVRDFKRPVDVMQLEVLAGDSEESAGKTIFAASELKWGAFRDVEERIGKYWIWGPLRTYAAYVFGAFKDLTWSCNALFRYTSPCSGCNRCQGRHKTAVLPNNQQPQQTRWWHAFIPKTPTITSSDPVKDYSQIINSDCGVWHEKEISSVEFLTLTENHPKFVQPNQPKHLEVNIGPKTLGVFEFIKEGWLRYHDTTEMQCEKILVQEFELIPEKTSSPPKEEVEKETETKTVKEPESEKWYSIDNDNYEVKSVRATLLPDAIKMFSQS